MGSQHCLFSLLAVIFFALNCFHGSSALEEEKQLYIVWMGEKRHEDPERVTASHHDILSTILGSKEEALASIVYSYKHGSIVYSYKHGLSGFAAMLTESQAKAAAELPEVISIKLNKIHRLHTTRSWDFLGLNYYKPTGLLNRAKQGEGIIIGVIDTESQSFNDYGYGPIPSRWRGTCQVGEAFDANHCSRKIIGARWYLDGHDPKLLKGEIRSARDTNGHGTHTASTAAGNLVHNVSFHGLAAGDARGGAPRARIAVYKACWEAGCSQADVMKAIDDAINDGVDVLSLSLGGQLFEYPGTLYAVSKGIVVVFSAGNYGPAPQTVSNAVPWVITVAASTIDRSFPTVITLGNNQKLVGQSIYYELERKNDFTELVNGQRCDPYSLNRTNVVGKIVLCFFPSDVDKTLPSLSFPNALDNVLKARGAGLIFAQYTVNNLDSTSLFKRFPCVLVDFEIAHKIATYIATTSSLVKVSPTINVGGKEVLSPKIAAFSSRGPSVLFPGILKPDITAPGVTILAAAGNEYVFKSGTSMACPHVSGVAALLKSLHPDWSPAAIKSAIVTTGSVVDGYGLPIKAEGTPRKLADPFDFGGGHIDPNRAADPGLIYDINPNDYTKFFKCTIQPSDDCDLAIGPLYYLNLPSIAIPDLKQTVTVWRTVANVGPEKATYKAIVEPPAGVKTIVEPSLLVFDAKKKWQTFKVTFISTRRVQGDYTFGSLTWSDANHSVRIPIAIRTVIQDFYADTA